MFQKFEHKFKDKPLYNFLVIFVGLLFAFYIVVPDEWHRPLPLLMAALASALIGFIVGRKKV
jgi:uncharacterized BrkB/YihY/UPF0761 family membrane protein